MKDSNQVKIGRASDADVRITDISVSRNHAELKLINGEFYISDCHSKFGTLARVRNNLKIVPNRTVALQLNRNFIILKMNKTFMSFIRCYRPRIKVNNNYNTYLEGLINDDDMSEKSNETYDVDNYDSSGVENDNVNLKFNNEKLSKCSSESNSNSKFNSDRDSGRNKNRDSNKNSESGRNSKRSFKVNYKDCEENIQEKEKLNNDKERDSLGKDNNEDDL